LFLLIIMTFTFVAPLPKAGTQTLSGTAGPVTSPPSATASPALGTLDRAPPTRDKAASAHELPALQRK
jgi:hypothetical protein